MTTPRTKHAQQSVTVRPPVEGAQPVTQVFRKRGAVLAASEWIRDCRLLGYAIVAVDPPMPGIVTEVQS